MLFRSNALYHQGDCGVLLDLHNLWVSARNGGLAVERYLERLNPAAVVEVHLAGGEELFGVYTDSHSRLTPEAVWSIAQAYLPCCPNLRAITFEYNDTYFETIGLQGVREELERMHQLAQTCRAPLQATPGPATPVPTTLGPSTSVPTPSTPAAPVPTIPVPAVPIPVGAPC